jgi:hypothetical protein
MTEEAYSISRKLMENKCVLQSIDSLNGIPQSQTQPKRGSAWHLTAEGDELPVQLPILF